MTTSGLLRPFDNWKKISWLRGHEFKLQYYTFFSFIISYLLLFTFSYFWFSYSLRKKIQKDFDKNIYAVPTQACLNIKAPFEHPRVMGLTGLGFDNMYDYFCLIFWFLFLANNKFQLTLRIKKKKKIKGQEPHVFLPRLMYRTCVKSHLVREATSFENCKLTFISANISWISRIPEYKNQNASSWGTK